MTQRPAKRLLILGWDAADWIMIRRLFDAGAMPNLRRLVGAGVHAELGTLEPKLSPLLWSSIATGKTADKHGILHFVEPDAANNNIRPATSTTRKTRALWNMLHQAGLRTHVVSWYASHPAEPVRGSVVSNLFLESRPADPKAPWPMTPGAVHPPELTDAVAKARVHPADLPIAELAALVPQVARIGRDDPRVRTLAGLVAQCRSVHRAALAVLRSDEPWDCAMVFQEAIDTIGHHFMQHHPPRMAHVKSKDFEQFRAVMDGVYAMHDAMLGELLDAAGPQATVLLLSDHGFHSGDQRPVTEGLSLMERAATEAAWHRDHGVLVMHGPGVRAGSTPASPNILDIAPTALALLGLPKGRDMDGRVLAECLTAAAPSPIPSWDSAPGDAGEHPDDLRQDPFEAEAAIRQLVDLGYMAALPEDAQARLDLVRRETAFNLGVVHLSRGRANLAESAFAPLVAESHEPRYATVLARAQLAAARPERACDTLDALLAREPDHQEARLLHAGALAEAGRPAEAMAVLRPMLATDSGIPATTLGDLCIAAGDADAAERVYRRAAGGASPDPAALVGLARVELARARFEPAAERCLDALEARPDMPDANHLLGVSLAWLGEHEDAARAFETVLAVQPGRIESLLFLAALHDHAGRSTPGDEARARVDAMLKEQGFDERQRAQAMREPSYGPRAWRRSPRAAPGA